MFYLCCNLAFPLRQTSQEDPRTITRRHARRRKQSPSRKFFPFLFRFTYYKKHLACPSIAQSRTVNKATNTYQTQSISHYQTGRSSLMEERPAFQLTDPRLTADGLTADGRTADSRTGGQISPSDLRTVIVCSFIDRAMRNL